MRMNPTTATLALPCGTPEGRVRDGIPMNSREVSAKLRAVFHSPPVLLVYRGRLEPIRAGGRFQRIEAGNEKDGTCGGQPLAVHRSRSRTVLRHSTPALSDSSRRT